jgi:hypothetical protein
MNMAVKKRASLQKEKRRIRMKPRQSRVLPARFEESILENPAEIPGDMI